MYSDQGSSQRPLLRTPRRFRFRGEDATDSNPRSKHAVFNKSVVHSGVLKSLREAPKARPLDLMDDFEIMKGIPTFTWKDSPHWTSFHVMALSSDKTRMALVEKEQKICVYDLLDKFRLIAEFRESFNGVNCVAFPRTKNNEIIVVHENSKISFLSIPVYDSEPGKSRGMELLPQKLHDIDQHCILPQYNFLHVVYFMIACHTSESWVLASNPRTPEELDLFSVSNQEYQKVKIVTEGVARHRAKFMSIPYKALMSVVESEANNKTKKTLIWKGIDFKENVIRRRPIEIEGQGIGLSGCGKYFLVWSGLQMGLSVLALYDIEMMEHYSTPSLSSMLLPSNILDVKAKLFDRMSIELSGTDLTCHENIPVIAFLVADQKKVFLTIWDPHKAETLKQVEFTTRSMVWSPDTELQFCLSPNLKWIALGGWSSGTFALFSLVSELLVWYGTLLDEKLARWPYSAFEFDASSTKLIINCSKKLYACAPPCLIEDYPIEMRAAKYELRGNSNNSLLSPLTWKHQRLLSKELLKRSILAQLGLKTEEYIESFDVAVSKSSQTVVLLVWKIAALLFVGSLDNFSPSIVRGLLGANHIVEIHSMMVPLEFMPEVFIQLEVSWENPLVYAFLYPDPNRKEDRVVIFALNEGLSAAFRDSSSTWTQPVPFSSERCFQIKQSNDGYRVICLMLHEVMIIDLNRREPVHAVNVKDLLHDSIHNLARERRLDNPVDEDPECIAIAEMDTDHTKVVCVRRDTEEFFIADRTPEYARLFPFVLHIGYSHFAYMENVSPKRTPTKLGVMNSAMLNSKKTLHRRITNEQWNPHTKKMMNALFSSTVEDYSIELDDRAGHLWVIGLSKEKSSSNLVFIPFGPFSLDKCVPKLCMEDYPTRSITTTELESMSDNFGAIFFTMVFNGKSNCDIIFEEKDLNLALKVLHVANSREAALSIEREEKVLWNECDNLLELAIEGNDYSWAKTCLDLTFKDKPPSKSASVIRKCFPKLWTNFQSLAIFLCEDDALMSNICDLEIYDIVLNMDDFLQARVGTCDSTEAWTDAASRGVSFSHWRACHENDAIQIERRGTPTKIKARLKVFYVDDVCKVGLKGIIRFLLMNNAPSYIFKSSLIKWVIIYKWETIWRRRSSRNLVIYLFYIGAFSAYTISIGYYGESLKNFGVTWLCLFILLCVTCLMAFYMTYKEVIQLITCCHDGKELFENRLYGFQSYFSSPWNVLEVMSYIMLFVVFCLHIVCLYDTDATVPTLYTCSAVEVLMMWMKIWYYAQPFKKTGALVLLVENVIRDCVPFLLLTLGVLAGFGIAMYSVFQSILYQMDFEEDNETSIAIDQGFGNPAKSVLTLFYAMVGMFDPTFFLNCGLWSILIIAIFVSYLSIQMILMLNMLIALMGDTFDRVKNTEEEQLLLGRARFIDACEAQLLEKQIENIEKNVDKWLYVIFPKDQNESEEVKQWQGRVKTIEDTVKTIVRDSQNSVVSEMKEEINSKVTSLRKEIETLKKNGKSDTQSLKEMIKECFAEIRGESRT